MKYDKRLMNTNGPKQLITVINKLELHAQRQFVSFGNRVQ